MTEYSVSSLELSEASSNEALFATFILDGLEFALDIGHVRDAIPEPDPVVPLPASPDYVAGIITLRDSVIPVIDTGKRFRMNGGNVRNKGHIAIACCKDRLMGLRFDRICEVIRVGRRDIHTLPPEFQREGDLLSGVISIENGRRLIQIINLLSLFDYRELPEGWTQGRGTEPTDMAEGSLRQAVIFMTGGQRFAVDADRVQEAVTVPEIHQKILVEGYILGVGKLRGSLISIVDFRHFMEGKNSGSDHDSRVVVLKHGTFRFGILVDAICEVSSYREGEIREMPVWSGNRHEGAFTGALERKGETVILIDMDKLFAEAFSRVKSHTSLHKDEKEGFTASGKRAGTDSRTETFITFSLDEVFAVPIEQVREIVPASSDLKAVPGQCDHVQGLLTLRSAIIPVVNLRRYLGRETGENGGESLIMILTLGERHIGILIDRLLEIAKIPADDTANVAALLSKNRLARCRELADRVISLGNRQGEAQPVIVLDVEKLMMKIK
jgi:purine-binding chemotaxis protein CheW